MSELELEPDLEPGAGPYLPQGQTSRLAIFSALSAFFCVPGLSALLGIGCGLFALRQINTSSSIQGANLAWAGIIGGLFNLVIWGTVANHVLQLRAEVDAPAQRFISQWMQGEKEGEAAASHGLAPLMRNGEGAYIRKGMLDQLGPFKAVGERTTFGYGIKRGGEEITARYPVQFASGAPCEVELEYGREQGQLQVVGFVVRSPLLHDLGRHTELHAKASPELQDFEDRAANGPPPIKSYRP